MIKVLFVCTGNICRSPMAEAVMRSKLAEAGMEGEVEVDSSAITSYHEGEGADPRTLAVLKSHGIEYEGRARSLAIEDFEEFDYILGMGKEHVEELRKLKPERSRARVELFMDYASKMRGEDVPDPWYEGGFDQVFEMVEDGVEGLIEKITMK